MISFDQTYNVLIATYLEPEYVEKIRQVDTRLNVIYEPGLIPQPRYAGDHTGHPISRTPEEENRWQELLASADILFDFDKTHKVDMPELAKRVRWIQATSTGIGQFVHDQGYDKRMPNTIFTVAGVHGRPLAEFCIMTLLMHYKHAELMNQRKQQKSFDRYSGTDTEGRTMAIVGLGRNGSAVARLARGIGMRVIGTDIHPQPEVVDRYFKPSELDEMLSQAEVLVITVPETPQTKNMIDARELTLLKPGAFLINIARGSIVNEEALIAALKSGQLSGAASDVFQKEPLPKDNPLWDMPGMLICPHSASISDRENSRLTDVFCDNLRRFLDDRPLRNILNTELQY